MIIEAIILLVIIFNLPSIIAFGIGILWGLIDIAAEKAADSYTENNDEQSHEECVPGTRETVFFSGCETPEDLKARYRALMKIYHPDGEHGDVEVAKRINAEYEMVTVGAKIK